MRQKATDLALIRQRVEKLERENSRLRRGFVAVSLGLGTSLVLGLTSTPGLRPTLGFGMGYGSARQTHALGPPGAAQDFVLRDARGVTRAKLDAKATTLTFFDYRGTAGGTLDLETGTLVSASAPRNDRPLRAPSVAQAVSPQVNPIRQVDGGKAETQPAVRNPFVYPDEVAGRGKANSARRSVRAAPPTRKPVAESPILIAQLDVPVLPRLVAAAPAETAVAPLFAPTPKATQIPAPAVPAVLANSLAPSMATPPAVVPLPPMTLTVVGYVETPGERKAVVVSDGAEVHVVHQDDVFDERFKVTRIESGTIEIEDTSNHQTLNLPINP